VALEEASAVEEEEWDGMTGRVSTSPGGYWIPYVEVFAALIAVVPSLGRPCHAPFVVCLTRKSTKVKLQTVCVSKQATRFKRSGERTCLWGAGEERRRQRDRQQDRRQRRWAAERPKRMYEWRLIAITANTPKCID
jgi:hypothetical protein